MTNSSVGFPQFYQIQQILDRFLEYFSAHDVALVKGHFMISTSREAKRFTHLHMCNFIIANIAGNLDYV
ncbi:hypothetical protein FAM18132_00589 [Lacticaseibacillus paracasei]|uniref:Uncharacterized protein n=1 Tax=Lacticaseibacillus paracasei TaxID=1597 RepID=A0A422LWW3_LACPA|nr:hypothetical protein FAM18105_00607 [Lacticaseibacillus paracasei]RND73768.1 hypothetical protein FAM18132_00589 [Lacticaseibacillus paracasei]RND78592.1 hypothetical protein FAM18157_02860 [Lacticaseibacillus paracasei]